MSGTIDEVFLVAESSPYLDQMGRAWADRVGPSRVHVAGPGRQLDVRRGLVHLLGRHPDHRYLLEALLKKGVQLVTDWSVLLGPGPVDEGLGAVLFNPVLWLDETRWLQRILAREELGPVRSIEWSGSSGGRIEEGAPPLLWPALLTAHLLPGAWSWERQETDEEAWQARLIGEQGSGACADIWLKPSDGSLLGSWMLSMEGGDGSVLWQFGPDGSELRLDFKPGIPPPARRDASGNGDMLDKALDGFLEARGRHALDDGPAWSVIRSLHDQFRFSPRSRAAQVDGVDPEIELDLFQRFESCSSEGRSPLLLAKIEVESRCNQSCRFCIARQDLEQRVLSLDQLRGLLLYLRSKGIDGVTFSGGEPTLRQDLPDILRFAQEAGLPEISMETNGLRAAKSTYAHLLAVSGLTSAFVSFHSHRSEIFSRITGCPESGFRDSVAGIRNLILAGVRTDLNVVVNGLNYQVLEELVRFIRDELTGVNAVSFSYVAPMGRALDDSSLIPRLSKVGPYLRRAIEASSEAGLRPTVPGRCGVPFCVLPGMEEYFIDFIEWQARPFRHIALKLDDDRIKVDACRSCTLNPACRGVWKAYADIHGLDELTPLSAGKAGGGER